MRELQADTVVDGRYRVISRIGSGGMADVYCAEDLQLGRKVALKLLYSRFAEDQEFVERFRREASSAAGLQHPNVVSVYDRGQWGGTYYIAMEYLDGRSLKQVVREEGPLDPVRAIDLAQQILKAARFAHRRGVIHRDLKPHNAIVDGEGRLKVTDFGIARAGASDMTQTGSIMGTAQYLSPEQAQGHAVSAASDLYAIGVVLYELLTGRVPFEGDSAVTIALKQVSEAPVAPSAYNPAITPELEAAVLRALEKDPARRFSDADEFIAALDEARAALVPRGQATAQFAPVPVPAGDLTQVAGAAPIAPDAIYPAHPLPPAEPRGPRRWPWALVAVLLLAGVAIAAWAVLRPAQAEVPDVTGRDLATASAVLHNAGFDVDVQRVTSRRAKDTVLRQDPQPGTDVDEGTTIELTVSDGPGTVAVPDVTNRKRKTALRMLREAGLRPRVEEEPSDEIDRGRATRTSPPVGTTLEKGQAVTVFISTGPEQVLVPDVTGRSREEATTEIEAAGLKVRIVEEESEDEDPGTVLRQDPVGGAAIDKGQVVTLTVAKASDKVEVPDVVGDTQEEAASSLSALGLTVIFADEDVNRPADDGVVLAQSPSARRKVKKGSRVTITVGRFNPDLAPPADGENP